MTATKRDELEARAKVLNVDCFKRHSREFEIDVWGGETSTLGGLRNFINSLSHLPDDTDVCGHHEREGVGVVVRWKTQISDEELEKLCLAEEATRASSAKIYKDKRKETYLKLKAEFDPPQPSPTPSSEQR